MNLSLKIYHLSSRFSKKLAIFLGLLLTSCQLWKGYVPPCAITPADWKNNQGSGLSLPEDWKSNSESADLVEDACPNDPTQLKAAALCKDLKNWWEIFEDPTLNLLEEQAINNSYTLWAALERVLQARYQTQINYGALLPTISFNPSFKRSGMLIENPISNAPTGMGAAMAGAGCYSSSFRNMSNINNQLNNLTNANNQAVQAIENDQLFRMRQTQYLLPLDFNYEIDLWGRLTNAYHAALFREQAAYDAYLSVLLTLTGDVASNYFQLRGLDAEHVVLTKTIESRQAALEINEIRFKAGLIVYSDVTRAQVELATARANKVEVIRQRTLQEDIIATLIGVPASVFYLDFNPLASNAIPPVIPTGLPAELLCRRPDIAEAERNLAAAYEDIGVAYTRFFPSLNLSASLGFESSRLSDLISWRARFWQIAANVMQVIFDGGRTEANYRYFKSKYQEAVANYEQQVLNAFRDVEDSLINLRQRSKLVGILSEGLKAAQETTTLSRVRYDQGLTSYLEVVDAERDSLNIESNLTNVIYLRYLDTVLLIRALGGGWGPCLDDPNSCFVCDLTSE